MGLRLLCDLASADGSEASRRLRSTDVEGCRPSTLMMNTKQLQKNVQRVLVLWCAPIGSCREVKRAWHPTDTSWLPSPVHGHVRYFAKPLERKIVRPTSKHADDSPSPVWPPRTKVEQQGVSIFCLWLRIFCVSVRSILDVTKSLSARRRATTSWERYERDGAARGKHA